FSGSGGATATANLTGIVQSFTVTARGSGYTSAPTVMLDNTGTGGSGAAVTAVLTGAGASVNLTVGGSGYTSAPTVTFTGGGGSGAAATVAAIGGLATGTSTVTKSISATTGLECSPITEILTGSGTDFIFFGAGNASNGQVSSEDVTNASL